MNYMIPLGVAIYTYLGGLKSTILSDYIQYAESGTGSEHDPVIRC